MSVVFGDERLAPRIWRQLSVDPVTGCWLWAGGRSTGGYAQTTIGSRRDGSRVSARLHRVAYEALVGPVPEGLELDHLCRMRHCINPAHLEPVTKSENVRRGTAGLVNGGRQRAKTHCPHGHEYSPANTIVATSGKRGPHRRCRACCNARARSRYVAR